MFRGALLFGSGLYLYSHPPPEGKDHICLLLASRLSAGTFVKLLIMNDDAQASSEQSDNVHAECMKAMDSLQAKVAELETKLKTERAAADEDALAKQKEVIARDEELTARDEELSAKDNLLSAILKEVSTERKALSDTKAQMTEMKVAHAAAIRVNRDEIAALKDAQKKAQNLEDNESFIKIHKQFKAGKNKIQRLEVENEDLRAQVQRLATLESEMRT